MLIIRKCEIGILLVFRGCLMIKALFFDLDGTLLTAGKIISQKTRAALESCRKSGLKLFVATARPPLLSRMLSWDEDTLSLFDGGSYYNGGCIEIREQKQYISISDKIIKQTISHVFDYDNINIALQLEGEIHAFRFPLKYKSYRSWGIAAQNALVLDQTQNLNTVKILIFYSDLIDSVTPIDDKLVTSLKALCLDTAQFYLTDKGKCIQIMARAVNKLSSIEKIRKVLGYQKDEIAVFGDDVNDIEMLSEYQYSVAMGNSEKHVKDAATYITLDNDSDGIYHALHNILQLV